MEVLNAAEKWGIPPWQLEETAPDIWMERQLLWLDARAQSRPKAQVGQVQQVGNRRRTRVF